MGKVKVRDKLAAMLADGKPHSLEELHTCLSRPSVGNSAIHFQLNGIRQKLREAGEEDVVCMRDGASIYYQQVRLLPIAKRTRQAQ